MANRDARSGDPRRPGADGLRASALWLCAAVLLFAGCVRDVPLLAPEGRGEEPGSVPPPPAGGYPDLNRPYALLPGDEIEIQVLEPEAFSFRVPIPDNETIELLKSDTAEAKGRATVKTRGLTVEQLKDAIADAYYPARFRQRPYVVVTLLKATTRKVYLSGAIKTDTGVLELPPTGRMTLSRAILAGGGTTEEADRSRVQITRQDPASGTRVSLPAFDLEEMERTATYDRDPPVEPNDIITVHRLGTVSIFGNVNQPGSFLCKRRMTARGRRNLTLTELFSEAGGLKPFSKLSQVLVIRGGEGSATEQTYFVDVDAIFDGKAQDPVLLPGDRVFVDEDWK